jgi:hypothetical protein
MLSWYAALLVLQASAGAFFVAVHRDRPATLAVLPLLGLYGSFIITWAWFISIVDEVRGAPMRW